MKRLFLIMMVWVVPLVCVAETRAARDTLRHEVRVGWGDLIFETAMFHAKPNTNLNTDHYRYTGHLFAEYQYRCCYWFSFGGIIDYDQVNWRVLREGDNAPDHYYVNLMFMPSVRFTYLHSEWVNVYSALFAGLNINTGTEENFRGEKTRCAPAFGVTLLGLSIGRGHWFGTAEWGAVSAFNNMNEIYKLNARILTVSVGYRF